MGANDFSKENYVSRTAVKVIPHPNFDDESFLNDIALLKLSEPVTFNEFLSPICLPNNDDNFQGIILLINLVLKSMSQLPLK